MNKNRWIFYAIFGLFHVGAFIFTIALDGNSNLLLKMYNWVWSFKWVTLLGLLLLIVDVIWTYSAHRTAQREMSALNHEINVLKAKMFDLQEAQKRSTPPQNTPNNPVA